jgi:hypothetical protein
MNIDDLTIGEAKSLAALFSSANNFNTDDKNIGNYVIVRTHSAGVFAGYLDSRNGQEVIVSKARRLYYWSGASSLSQLAMEGVKHPDKCKFPCPVDSITLTQAIEIIPTTEAARLNIALVPIWEQ